MPRYALMSATLTGRVPVWPAGLSRRGQPRVAARSRRWAPVRDGHPSATGTRPRRWAPVRGDAHVAPGAAAAAKVAGRCAPERTQMRRRTARRDAVAIRGAKWVNIATAGAPCGVAVAICIARRVRIATAGRQATWRSRFGARGALRHGLPPSIQLKSPPPDRSGGGLVPVGGASLSAPCCPRRTAPSAPRVRPARFSRASAR
jgi:hypothetical protein